MFAFIIPHCPLSVKQKAKKLYPRLPRCPLWGWCSAQRIKIVMIAGGNHTFVSCREAAKGVPLVALSCFHSMNHTPSVSLCSTAPPLGSQGPRCPLWGWCVAQPSLPPLGVVLRAANQDSNDCRWQSYLCFVPRSGKGGAVGNFELLPFNERHPSVSLCSTAPPPGRQGCTPSSSILFTKCFLTLRGSFAIIRGDFGRGRR